MPKTVYTSTGIRINLEDTPLATPGGEGAVYRVLGGYSLPNCCVKIYHADKRSNERRNKIAYMSSNPPANLITDNYVICWPLESIYDTSRNFVGFIMKLAFTNSESLYILTLPDIPPKFLPKWQKFERTKADAVELRLKVCVNIAIAVHAIHGVRNYAMVDYKPQNLLISLTGKVSVTDVDSFQIAGSATTHHHAAVCTPEYAPPESLNINLERQFVDQAWDRFSIAVSFYELLFGLHPFAATTGGPYTEHTETGQKIKNGLFVHGSGSRFLTKIPPPHQNFDKLPSNIRHLFMLTFEGGHNNPLNRPTAEQWGQTIAAEIRNFRNIVFTLQPKSKPQAGSVRPADTSPPVSPRPPARPTYIPPAPIPVKPKRNYGGYFFLGLLILVVLFFLVRTANNSSPIVPGASDSTKPAVVQPVSVLPIQTKVVKSASKKTKIKNNIAPVDSCDLLTGHIYATNQTGHNVTVYLSIYSPQTQTWSEYVAFPNVGPDKAALTDDAGVPLVASQYRFYVEDAVSGNRFSAETPSVKRKCDGNFAIDL